MATIQIELPDEVLNLPNQSEETLRTLAREALLVRLLRQRVITTRWAALPQPNAIIRFRPGVSGRA
jgi:hypothetical protein